MARAIPSFAENTHGIEGRGESFVCARQPLQESSAHIGRATGGGASATTTTSSTISLKIEPKHQVQEQGHSRGVIRPVSRVKPSVQPQPETLQRAAIIRQDGSLKTVAPIQTARNVWTL